MKKYVLIALLPFIIAATAVVGSHWKQVGSILQVADDITGIDFTGLTEINFTNVSTVGLSTGGGVSSRQDAYDGGATTTTSATNDQIINKYGGDNGVIQEWQKADGTPVFVITTGFKMVRVVQRRYTSFTSGTTGTGVIPYDDSIPDQTEGDEYMSLTITPKSVGNKLRISSGMEISGNTVVHLLMTLFRQDDTAAMASAVKAQSLADVQETLFMGPLIFDVVSTIPQEYKIFMGGNGAGTRTVNGRTGARRMGGTMPSYFLIEEVTP